MVVILLNRYISLIFPQNISVSEKMSSLQVCDLYFKNLPLLSHVVVVYKLRGRNDNKGKERDTAGRVMAIQRTGRKQLAIWLYAGRQYAMRPAS